MSRDWTQLRFREMTWGERAQAVLCWIAGTIFGLVVLVGIMVYAVGPTLDGIGRYQEEHERCLKRATNGLEIERCR